MFESGREWGFILVIAAAYFEGGKLKIHEYNSFQKLASHDSSGKKIRYLELVEKFYQFASKYVLMTLLGGRFRLHYCVWWVEPSQQPSQPLAHSPSPSRMRIRIEEVLVD